MRGRPHPRLLALLLGLLVCLWALPLGAAQVSVAGRVLGPEGQPVAGAMVSDGVGLTKSDANGAFSLASQSGRVVALTAPAGMLTAGRWWWPAEEAAQVPASLEAWSPGLVPSVALLSDPHLMDSSCPTVDYPAPLGGWDLAAQVWQQVAAQVAALKPALTVVAGDLCMDGDKGDAAHTESQMKLAAQSLALLPPPSRALPGNHDVRYHDGNSGSSVDAGLWLRYLGPTRHVFVLKGMAWIFIDNCGRGQSPSGKPRSLGQTPPEALDWLKLVLEALPKDLPLVLVSHYPLASPVVGANPLFGGALVKADSGSGANLRDADQAAPQIRALLKNRPVLALISGHEHAFHQSLLGLRGGACQLIGLPAVCGHWWLGDRTWGEVAFPPGYLVVTLRNGAGGPRLESRFVEVKF